MLTTNLESRFAPVTKELQGRIQAEVCAMTYESSVRRIAPRSRLGGMRLGSVDVIQYESHGVQRGVRTMGDVRKDHADVFMICIPRRARFHLQQNRSQTDIDPGSMAFLTTTKPFNAYIYGVDQESAFSSVQIRVPGPLLRQRLPGIDDFCGRRVSIDTAAGQIMRSMIEASLIYGGSLREAETARFSMSLVDIIANAALMASDEFCRQESHTKSSHSLSFERATQFIEANLSNPNMDVACVAKHCGVSTRYLQQAFSAYSVGVAGYIREARLQRCRTALQEHQLRGRSILEIAGDWGFQDPSHFSRLFRRRFGDPPRLHR